MLLLYSTFAVSIFSWTLSSGLDTTNEMKFYYFLGFLMLIILAVILNQGWKRNVNLYICGICVLLLTNIGLSLAYRMQHSKQYFMDMILISTAFIIVYLIVRYTNLYCTRIVNYLIIAGLPLMLIVTRCKTELVNGAYISFFGILIFGLVLCGYPFVAAFYLSKKEEVYLRGTVRSMPVNLLYFLLYTFILYGLCAICNEFGLLLVLGITSTLLFYIRSKQLGTKVLYTLACGGGAVLACCLVPHIRDRVNIWLHLSTISPDNVLAGKAESILYLYRNLKRTGWYGNGLGSVPVSVFPTLNTDHAVVALILEYSLILAIGVLISTWIYIKAMLQEIHTDSLYNYILNLSSGLIVGAVVMIHVGSNLGSSITAGVSYPFVSEGSSTNLMFAVLTGIHCAIYERRRKNVYTKKEMQYEN